MIRPVLLLSAAGLALSGTPASSAVLVYSATLLGTNENPSVTTTGTGSALVTIDNILNTMRVQVSFSGLLGNTTASHIHCCQPLGTNAGVATTTPTFAGFPLGVTSGTYDNTLDMTLASSYNPAFVTAHGNSVTQARTDLFAGIAATQSYLNVHTSLFPGGEIRGQLIAVPEPAAWALMIAGFGLAGGAVRLRRREALA